MWVHACLCVDAFVCACVCLCLRVNVRARVRRTSAPAAIDCAIESAPETNEQHYSLPVFLSKTKQSLRIAYRMLAGAAGLGTQASESMRRRSAHCLTPLPRECRVSTPESASGIGSGGAPTVSQATTGTDAHPT